MFPLSTALVLAVVLFASFIRSSEFNKKSYTLKRLRDDIFEQHEGSAFHPRSKRKEVNLTPITQSNPPDIYQSIHDTNYFESLSPKIKGFLRIFKAAWLAYETDFFLTGNCNFELMNWEENSLITNLNFETHLQFILQLLKNGESLKNLNTAELLSEYINFTLSYYVQEAPLSTETFLEMLTYSTSSLEPQTFRTILNYRPRYLLDNDSNRIWYALIQTALKNDFDITKFSKEANIWIELFYLLSLSFGPNFDLNKHQIKNAINKSATRFNGLLKLQPIISAIARHDSNLFISILDNFEFIEFAKQLESRAIHFWVNRFLSYDDTLKRFDPENEEKFSALADKIYIFLCYINPTNPLPRLLDEFFVCHCNLLPQFLLKYSERARNSISIKAEQCQLLRNLVQVTDFDFDYIQIITIITGFDLKWDDLKEHLIPNLEPRFRNTPLTQGLKFILQLAESFPSDFSVPWSISSISSCLEIDPEYPFIFDAGRIILDRHFKILPSFTELSDFRKEEACFRDLCWFMTFYINIYRPDLGGSEFKLNILESL
jgi:hypothetical protein